MLHAVWNWAGFSCNLGASAISMRFFKVQVEQEQTFGTSQGKEQEKRRRLTLGEFLARGKLWSFAVAWRSHWPSPLTEGTIPNWEQEQQENSRAELWNWKKAHFPTFNPWVYPVSLHWTCQQYKPWKIHYYCQLSLDWNINGGSVSSIPSLSYCQLH